MVDLKRIGEFIAACRREKKLTQKQLGEKLNVTDRAADSLYSFYFRQEQYEKAEQYLACFSGHDPERKRKQAQIYRKTGRTQEAYQILEELLFSYFQLVSASLHGLYMLSAEDGDLEQAHLLVKKEKLLARLIMKPRPDWIWPFWKRMKQRFWRRRRRCSQESGQSGALPNRRCTAIWISEKRRKGSWQN